MSGERTGGPEAAGDVGKRLLEGWAESKCTACGGGFMLREGTPLTVCPDCRLRLHETQALAAEAASILAEVPRLVERALTLAGVTARQRTARLDLIPDAVRRVFEIRELGVDGMIAGDIPSRGFGLAGGLGCGKTFALVAVFRSAIAAKLTTFAPILGRRALTSWFGWCSWPEEVNRLRVLSTEEDGLARASDRIQDLAKIGALVIDDLGVERLRGSYEDDWAASQLDMLVDARYNGMRPTWYTTNLDAHEFRDRYGSRILSRLCGENPMKTVGGPDLRMVKP